MSKLRVFHHLNEGPFCGCWSEGWLAATEEATEEEIRLALVNLAADLSEMCYELNKDSNEYDEEEDEEAFLERDTEIALESSCGEDDFCEIADESDYSFINPEEYDGIWNDKHTIWVFEQ